MTFHDLLWQVGAVGALGCVVARRRGASSGHRYSNPEGFQVTHRKSALHTEMTHVQVL